MIIFLTTVHVLVCFFLIIVVLLQSGKAADLAGAFGGMGSQTAFGPRGAATLLSKATTVAAVVFMVTSIWLGIERSRSSVGGESVIERTGEAAPASTETSPAEGEATQEASPTAPAGESASAPAAVEQPTVEVTPGADGSTNIEVGVDGRSGTATPAQKKP